MDFIDPFSSLYIKDSVDSTDYFGSLSSIDFIVLFASGISWNLRVPWVLGSFYFLGLKYFLGSTDSLNFLKPQKFWCLFSCVFWKRDLRNYVTKFCCEKCHTVLILLTLSKVRSQCLKSSPNSKSTVFDYFCLFRWSKTSIYKYFWRQTQVGQFINSSNLRNCWKIRLIESNLFYDFLWQKIIYGNRY